MVDMVSWVLCSAHSSIMKGKSDTVTAVALRGSGRERERQSGRRRESMQRLILSSSSRKIGDSLQHRRDIHAKTHTFMHTYTHTSPLPLLVKLNMP